jgi:cytochrome c oxidase subunit II
MRGLLAGASLTVAFGSVVSLAAALPNVERGQRIFDICGACHGPKGEGNDRLLAPPLAGQQSDYLLRQLRDFRSGTRQSPGDTQSREMEQILDTVPNESDWIDTVAFISTLAVQYRSIPADAGSTRGRDLYVSCAGCHGQDGQGNPALDAPNLALLPRWYIEGQLRKYRSGTRGHDATDVPGARMRAAAAALASDEDVALVSAYIVQESKP